MDARAQTLWKNARGKYELYPEYFDPEYLLKISPTTITRVLRDLGIRYVHGGTKAWKGISEILVNDYNGDPKNITPKETTVSEVKRKLQKFPHLRGRKLSNFYIRAMNERGLFKISDMKNLDIPVDLQVARFTVYTAALKLEQGSFEGCIHNNPIRSLIEEVWRKAANKIGQAPYELDEPIWTIGSKLCAKKKCRKCPVHGLCEHNFDAQLKNNRLIWSSTKQE